MKRAILCEGKTDAIILSLYLRAFGWTYLKKPPFRIDFDETSQTIYWYSHPQRNQEELMIWGVGGITRFENAVSDVIDRTRNESVEHNRFEKMAILFDKDERDDAQSLQLVNGWLTSASAQFEDVRLGTWTLGEVILGGSLRRHHNLSFLPLVIPLDEPGDLEIFLRSGIAKMSDADDKLVSESTTFIKGQPADPYLPKRRLRSKACLGVILSVISPDWVFGDLDQKLQQIPWVDLRTVQQAFDELRRI